MMIRDWKLLIELYHSIWCKCWRSTQNRAARISKYEKINFNDYTNKKKTEHNPKWPYIPDHPCKMLTMGSGSGKTNDFLNLITYGSNIDKI